MTGFIRGEFEGTKQPWADDPASTLVAELEHELTEELEADGPEYTRKVPEGVIGRLVDEDDGALHDRHREAVAHDSHDDSDLSAEESAIHYDDETSSDDPDLTPEVRAELDGF